MNDNGAMYDIRDTLQLVWFVLWGDNILVVMVCNTTAGV